MKKKINSNFHERAFFSKFSENFLTPLLNRSIFFVIDSTIFFNRFSFSPVLVNIDDYYSFFKCFGSHLMKLNDFFKHAEQIPDLKMKIH